LERLWEKVAVGGWETEVFPVRVLSQDSTRVPSPTKRASASLTSESSSVVGGFSAAELPTALGVLDLAASATASLALLDRAPRVFLCAGRSLAFFWAVVVCLAGARLGARGPCFLAKPSPVLPAPSSTTVTMIRLVRLETMQITYSAQRMGRHNDGHSLRRCPFVRSETSARLRWLADDVER